MKQYFICSDLHGIHPDILKTSLNKSGFDFNDANDILVVLGDITDGLMHEDKLIAFLKSLEKQGKLIAIKGNHDVWDGYYMPMNDVALLLDEDSDWLGKLPYQIETEHFNFAHGIFLPKEIQDQLVDPIISSIWGSPCLLNRGQWYRVSEQDIAKIKEWAKGISGYMDKIDKPTFIGHFTKDDVAKNLAWTGLLKETEDGFFHIDNKLFFIDRGVLRNQKEVQFYIVKK